MIASTVASGGEPLGDLDRAPQRRARGAAGEDALLAREPPRHQERVAVGDPDPLVDDLQVDRVGPRVLADPLDEVRMELGLVLGGVDRPLGIDADDLHLGLLLVEPAADAGDRPARADGDDDRVELAAGLLPDLGRGDVVVRLRVRHVRVLVGLEAARDLLGEPRRDGVVRLRRVVVDRGRRDHDLGAVRAEHRDLLLAHLVGHDEDAAVALAGRRDGEADAGVARGRLDDRPARLELPLALGLLDHREADPVLHRAARVQVLELGEDPRRGPAARAGRAGRSAVRRRGRGGSDTRAASRKRSCA